MRILSDSLAALSAFVVAALEEEEIPVYLRLTPLFVHLSLFSAAVYVYLLKALKRLEVYNSSRYRSAGRLVRTGLGVGVPLFWLFVLITAAGTAYRVGALIALGGFGLFVAWIAAALGVLGLVLLTFKMYAEFEHPMFIAAAALQVLEAYALFARALAGEFGYGALAGTLAHAALYVALGPAIESLREGLESTGPVQPISYRRWIRQLLARLSARVSEAWRAVRPQNYSTPAAISALVVVVLVSALVSIPTVAAALELFFRGGGVVVELPDLGDVVPNHGSVYVELWAVAPGGFEPVYSGFISGRVLRLEYSRIAGVSGLWLERMRRGETGVSEFGLVVQISASNGTHVVNLFGATVTVDPREFAEPIPGVLRRALSLRDFPAVTVTRIESNRRATGVGFEQLRCASAREVLSRVEESKPLPTYVGYPLCDPPQQPNNIPCCDFSTLHTRWKIERVLFDTNDPNLPDYLRGGVLVAILVRDQDAYVSHWSNVILGYWIENVTLSPRITVKLLGEDLVRIGGATIRVVISGISGGATAARPGEVGMILALGRGGYYLVTLYRCCHIRLGSYSNYAFHCEPADNEQGQTVRGLIGVITDLEKCCGAGISLSDPSDLVNTLKGLQLYDRVVVGALKEEPIRSEWVNELRFRFYPLQFAALRLFSELGIPWWADPVLSQIVDMPVAVEWVPIGKRYAEWLSLYNGDGGPLAVYIHRTSSRFVLGWSTGNATQVRTMYVEVRRS